MAYGIDRAQKLAKLNKKILDNTTDPSSAPPIHSYSYDKLNENTDITSKKVLTAEKNSRTILCI